MSTETDFHALPASTTAGQVMALLAAERILQGNRRLTLVAVPFKGSKPAPVYGPVREVV